MAKDAKWKCELTEQQRRTVFLSLQFLHREYGARITTGANSFDISACKIAHADLEDLLEIFEP